MRPMWGRHVHRHAHRPCPPHGRGRHGHPGHPSGDFGVRRPLRFLAHKLDLDDAQTAELARVLDALRTERAQVHVDERRARAALADAFASDILDDAAVKAAGELRVKGAERLRDAAVTGFRELHAVLRADQRKKLSTLLRTGPFAL